MRRRFNRYLVLAIALALPLALSAQTPPTYIITPTGVTFNYQAMPTSLTSVVPISSRLISVTFVNTTGSPITITFQTNDASPVSLPLAGSLAANTSVNFNIPAGLLCNKGFSVQAGGSGVNYSLVWKNP